MKRTSARPRPAWFVSVVPLAALLVDCGRTELGEAFDVAVGSSGGATSGGLVGATFGGNSTTGFGDSTAFRAAATSAVTTGAVTTGAGGSTGAQTTSVSTGGSSTTGASTGSVSGTGGDSTTMGKGGAAGACTDGSCGDSWGAPELIETDDAGSVLDPQVAMNRDGAGVVAWSQSDGVRENVWANRYTPGAGWAGAELLETQDGDGVNVRVAISDNEKISVVWASSAGTPNLWSTRAAGLGWGVAEPIGTATFAYPDLAMDGSGTAVALWRESADVGMTLWSSAASASWGGPAAIQSGTIMSESRLAMNAAGSTTAVWSEADSLWSSRSQAGLSWTTPELIQPASEAGREPDLALDPQGNTMVVWYQWTAISGARVWANLFTPDAGWGSPEIIDRASATAYYPRVGTDDDGNAIAVWQQGDGAAYAVWANRYSPASGWGAPEPIAASTTEQALPLQLAVGAAGDAVALWTQVDLTGANLWSNRYTPGSGWGDAQLVDATKLGGVGCGDVAIDGAGNAIAVWCHSADGPSDLWSSTSSRPE